MRTLSERFWSKVEIRSADDCWPWKRSRYPGGYGQFKAVAGQSPVKAHRIAFTLAYGDPGLFHVLHRCDNPPCCNPAHLFLGTQADNNADMIAKGRGARPTAAANKVLVDRVRRLDDDAIRKARALLAAGTSCRSVARQLGVAHTTISRLANETHWRGHLSA